MTQRSKTRGSDNNLQRKNGNIILPYINILNIFFRIRVEEISTLNERVQKALKSRDEENQRLTTLADQAQRRADYMEEMLDKQTKLLRQKNKK